MPEEFILFRRKYDAEYRSRLAKQFPNKYGFEHEDGNDLANEWWNAFCNLDQDKLLIAKKIISTNVFSMETVECSDKDILSVLEYYRISSKNHLPSSKQ